MMTLQDFSHGVAHKATDTMHAMRGGLEQLKEADLNRMRDNALNRVSKVNLNRMRADSAQRVSDIDLSKLSDALNRLDLSPWSKRSALEVLPVRTQRNFHPVNLVIGVAVGLGLGLVAGLIKASDRRLRAHEKQVEARLDASLRQEKEPATDF